MRADVARRGLGALALAFIGWQAGILVGHGEEETRNAAAIGVVAGAILGALLAPLFISAPYNALRRVVNRTPPGEFLYGVLGLILGLLVAALAAYPLAQLPWWLGHIFPGTAAVVFAYLGIVFLTMRRHELTGYIRGRFRDHAVSSEHIHGYLIDTSAIIDGRIADITHAGFLLGSLMVPRFVLSELQHIADSADPLRRAKGRRGLEILNRMQKESINGVLIVDAEAREIPDVDGKLVKIAGEMTCPVITNDFNLNRIAELQGVQVLNINQLANAMKPLVLPGEEMAVRIIQEGKEVNQGVGYLDDGTMIVVENGKRFLHDTIEIIVTRVLQTVAGRMIFAQPKSNAPE